MGRLIFLFCFLTTGLNAQVSVDKPKPTEGKTEFEEAFEKFEQLNLPISFNSERGFDMGGITRDSIGLRGIPFGRLFKSDSVFVSIFLHIPVYTIIPEIFTMDKKGNIIDSFDAFGTTGTDFGFYSIEDATIFPDKSMVFIDSTKTWDYDYSKNPPQELAGSRKLKVTKEKYKIRDNGKIEKVE